MARVLDALETAQERLATQARLVGQPPKVETYEQALDQVLAEVRATVLRRHKRYGHNLLRHGEFGIIVRVDDKTERLKNLLAQNEDDAEEPRSETWGDIAGYAAQAILIERGLFTLPMLDRS